MTEQQVLLEGIQGVTLDCMHKNDASSSVRDTERELEAVQTLPLCLMSYLRRGLKVMP